MQTLKIDRTNRLQAIIRHPMLTNSLNLMLATAASAGLGFIFLLIVTHSFRASTVGLATTLISMSTLLALLSQCGFDVVFVRFLAKSKQRNEHINSGLTISGIMATLLAAGFCALIPIISPKLRFVDSSFNYIISFIAFTVFATWVTLTNAIFVAYRRTYFVLIINIAFGLAKVGLPFVIHSNNPIAIFAIVGLAQALNVLLSILALIKYFGYRPSCRIHFDVIRKTVRFSLAAYLSNIMNLLPDSALPLIVVNQLGAVAAAYFYIAFAIANLLYTIAFSTAQALLAETTHDQENAMKHIRNGLRIMLGIMIPAVAVVFLICPFVLGFFGANYRAGATGLLRIMALTGVVVVFYSFLSFAFKFIKNLPAMLWMAAINAFSIIILSTVFAKRYGLIGVGRAWFIGTALSCIVGVYFLRTYGHKS